MSLYESKKNANNYGLIGLVLFNTYLKAFSFVQDATTPDRCEEFALTFSIYKVLGNSVFNICLVKGEMRMTLPIKEIVLAPGEGDMPPARGKRDRLTVGNSEVIFKAVGSDTHGHLGLFENVIQPSGTAPELHIHRQMEEMFYVLEGEVVIKVGNQTIQGQPGAFVLVPRNTPHTFANLGAEPAKLLIMFTPGGEREKYFEGLAELLKDGQKPNREALLELMRQFDQEPVNE